ncbi:MAG: HAD hydrolase-like protein [Firmicutes bacterium]|nr:HAD hydrolase-like protein [Bacillota bacterium]
MTAFLFDLDGTLHDSVPVICHVSQLAYAELGLERSLEEIKKTIGVPLVKTGEELFGPGNGDLYRLTYQRIYQEQESLFPLRAFPGIPEMLSALRERGARLAVVTSKRHQLTLENLETTGLLPLVEVVVDAQSTDKHKPDPEPALLALKQLGCLPEQQSCLPEQRSCLPEQQSCLPEQGVFIGDSLFDLGCGRNAGLKTVAVSWGAGIRQELADFQPDFLCDTVEELQQVLLSLQEASSCPEEQR